MNTSSCAAVRRLANVLDQENDALAAMDIRRATGLLAEKAAALSSLAALAGSEMAQTDPELTQEARRLDALVRDNRRLLERAMAAQTRVIGIMVRAAASVARPPSYGATGRMAGHNRPLAISTRA